MSVAETEPVNSEEISSRIKFVVVELARNSSDVSVQTALAFGKACMGLDEASLAALQDLANWYSAGAESEEEQRPLVKAEEAAAAEEKSEGKPPKAQRQVSLVDGALAPKLLSRPRQAQRSTIARQNSEPKTTQRLPAQKRRGSTSSSGRRERDADPEEDLVRQYLNEIGKYPLLTKEDEQRLGIQIEDGRKAQEALDKAKQAGEQLDTRQLRELQSLARSGQEANKQFINSNLRLVVSIAKRYQKPKGEGLLLLDLVQEGNLGLIHAVEKFDWRKGFKFSTYATWWIRQAITRGISNTERTVRLPVHAGDELRRITRARTAMEGQLGRRPTVAELAAHLEMDPARVIELLRHVMDTMSIHEKRSHDGDGELEDIIADVTAVSPEEAAERSTTKQELERLFEAAELDGRERAVLLLRYGLDRGEGRTLAEVGREFNVTRERVRQIESIAMDKLHSPRTRRRAGIQ